MTDENKTTLIIASAVVLTVLIVCAMSYRLSVINNEHDIQMAEKGYEQNTVPGLGGVYWVKKK